MQYVYGIVLIMKISYINSENMQKKRTSSSAAVRCKAKIGTLFYY